jgi:hypothetical protein
MSRLDRRLELDTKSLHHAGISEHGRLDLSFTPAIPSSLLLIS